MADNFANAVGGRCTTGGRFYAIPSANVPTNVIFMPAYSTSPLFGVAEYPVKSGELGAFATEGTFEFAKPDGWTSAAGQAVYWSPTSAVAGSFVAAASAAEGDVKIGFEVIMPQRSGLCVMLTPPTELVPAAAAGGGGTT